ncbi:MAG: hypothetical protein V1652_01365 [bacterium]
MSKLIRVGVLFILGLLFYLTMPLWHGIIMTVYLIPIIWWLAILWIGGLLLTGIIPKSEKPFVTWFVVGFFVLVVGGMLLSIPASLWGPKNIAHSLQVTEVSQLPDSHMDSLRVMPRAVADRMAKDSLQYPRYQLDTSDIVIRNEKPMWAYTLIPDGIINSFSLKDKGVMYVDMTTLNKNTETVETDLSVGPGMLLTDGLEWRIFRERYFIDHGDSFTLTKGTDMYIVVPIIEYERHSFYSIPKWGGVAIVDAKGEITFLNPEEAQNSDILQGQKLVPDSLARTWVNSLNYKQGILNVLFSHDNQFEIADTPNDANQQPFLIDTAEGLKWFIAVEPYGNAHGVFRIYMVDARAGTISVKNYSAGDPLLGPVSSTDYLKKDFPTVDWSSITPAEPIPVSVRDKLFWIVRAIASDGSGVSFVAVVDAQSGQVHKFENIPMLKEFLINGEMSGDTPTNDMDSSTSDTARIESIERQLRQVLEELDTLKNQQ